MRASEVRGGFFSFAELLPIPASAPPHEPAAGLSCSGIAACDKLCAANCVVTDGRATHSLGRKTGQETGV